MGQNLQQVLLDTSETVCNVIFSIEMVFKLMALGFCTHATRHTHPPSKPQDPVLLRCRLTAFCPWG